jgi:hypothetical protein
MKNQIFRKKWSMLVILDHFFQNNRKIDQKLMKIGPKSHFNIPKNCNRRGFSILLGGYPRLPTLIINIYVMSTRILPFT